VKPDNGDSLGRSPEAKKPAVGDAISDTSDNKQEDCCR